MCENSAIGLRGPAGVELEHAAEPRTARDRACADRRWLGRDELVAQTLVRPLLVIMLDERSYGSPEVPFAEGYDPREALGLGGANKPLGKCVGVSRQLHRRRAVRRKRVHGELQIREHFLGFARL